MNIKCFLDFEMNTTKYANRDPDESAFIQIAYVFTDECYKVLKTNSIFVKPWNNGCQLSDHMKNLTAITQEDIDNGLTLYEAINKLCDDILEYGEHKFDFFTFGNYDRYAYDMNMKQYRKYATENNLQQYRSIIDWFIDIQANMKKILCWRRDVPLKTLCDVAGIDKDDHHDALSDAMALMLVSKYFDLEECTHVLNNRYGKMKMWTGLKPKQHEIELQRGTPSKYLYEDVAKYLTTTDSDEITQAYKDIMLVRMTEMMEAKEQKRREKKEKYRRQARAYKNLTTKK